MAPPSTNHWKTDSEYIELLSYIIKQTENVESPLSIRQLVRDFKKMCGDAQALDCLRHRVFKIRTVIHRFGHIDTNTKVKVLFALSAPVDAAFLKEIRRYCREFQKTEFMDTHSKVRQLFGLCAKLDSDFLEKLRKDAVVEVDDLNRITKYTSNNGHLTLYGDHSHSAKAKFAWIARKKRRNAVEKHPSSGETDKSEKETEDDSDEYSSEEFGSEFDSVDENDHLDEPDHMDSSKQVFDFDNEIPIRNRSPTDMSIDDYLDFDPLTERSHRSEETYRGTAEENDPEITGNAVIKTRSGRLSKRRHLDSNFSYNLANSSSSGALTRSSSSYSKPAKHFHHPAEKSHVSEAIAMKENDGRKRKKCSPTAPKAQKMRNNCTTGFGSSIQIGLSSNDSMNPNELDDYDTNYSIEDEVKLEPFRGSIQEDFNEIKGDDDIQQIPKSHTHNEHNDSEEIPIKIKQEEPVEVKPETSHNSKAKFFEAMQSLIICLDSPFLSDLQTKIHQKIQKLGGSDEVILNNEIIRIIDLLISRMSNDSAVNLAETVESVNFSNFLCYLKAAILNSKMSGVDDLVKNISKVIEESQEKRIPLGEVVNALLVTLNIDGF